MIDPDHRTAPIRTFAEIGRILGITKNSVKDTHDRAIAKLRKALEDDFTNRKTRDERAEMNEG